MIKKSDFKPLWYLKNPHLQTLVANFARPGIPDLDYHWLDLPDGDRLQLVFGPDFKTDTVLILHGLEGSLKSAYAQRLLHYLIGKRVSVAMMLFRSCDGSPNRLLRSYHSGETGDLRSVIDYLKSIGREKLALIGYSLGGNVTLKYLGEDKPDPAIACAAAVSVPMLLDDCARRMNRGFSRIYQYALMKRLKHKVRQKRSLLLQSGYATDPDKLSTFVEFDDAFTAPIHGYQNAADYYHHCSSRQFIPNIGTHTLIIHSSDDPFMTAQVIPQPCEMPDSVTLELSDHGGHVGFIGGSLTPRFWLEPRLFSFVDQYLDLN